MNTKRFLPLLCLMLAAGFSFTSCRDGACVGSKGPAVVVDYPVDSFSGLVLSAPADVTIMKADTYSLSVEVADNIHERLEVETRDGNLFIDLKGCFTRLRDFNVTIFTPHMEYIEVEGSGDVNVVDEFVSSTASVSVSGSGNLTYKVQTEFLEAEVSGSGEARLSGSTTEQHVRVSGSGDYLAFPLNSEKATVKVSGSGDCEVTVTDELDVQISGSGDVFYNGTPRITMNVSGSGDLKQR